MGCAQMELLEDYVECKRKIACRYTVELSMIPGVRVMIEADGVKSSFWMFTILVDPEKFGIDSRQRMKALAKEKIQARPLWQPLHLSVAHRDAQVLGGVISEKLYRDAISLPCSVGLSDVAQKRVICLLKSFVK